MRKVVANLVFSHGYDDVSGTTYYKTRLFYVVTKDSRIIQLVNYGDNAALSYRYCSMEYLLYSMHRILKENNFKTDNVNIGDFVFDGIICSEIDEDSYISSPTRFSARWLLCG